MSSKAKMPLTASADSGTDMRGTGGPVPRHRPLRKSLALAAAALAAVLAATGVLTGVAPSSPSKAADAASRNWIASAGTVLQCQSRDHATISRFFSTPSSYVAGGNPARNPAPRGWPTTPVMDYTSYAEFASDVRSGAIRYPFRWVMYDPEHWAATPASEQRDPAKYMRLFGNLAHSRGMKVIMAPSLDLAYAPGSVYQRRARETGNQYYVRVTARPAAEACDLLVIQNESNEGNIGQYQWLYNNARAQAKAVHPDVIVDSEVSAQDGSASQMAAAARSVNADGYFVASAGDPWTVVSFFNQMQAAGY